MTHALVTQARNISNVMVSSKRNSLTGVERLSPKRLPKSSQSHWDALFINKDTKQLGWYESDLAPTLSLLDDIKDWQNKTIFLSGIGTSYLLDILSQHPVKITANDISQVALNKAKNSLNAQQNNHIEYLCQDVSSPIDGSISANIWLDRAVLHFLTSPKQQQTYVANINQTLTQGGYVLLAQFSTKGATMCAGLPIVQYSPETLQALLGKDFELIRSFEYSYLNPRGEKRPYIYTLFQKM